MKKIRLALVGCGRISKKHIAVAQQLGSDLELVAVCDIELDRAKRVAAETGATPYQDIKEMLAHEKLDLVSILTWSGNHAQLALECVGKVPNIVVEKPMALRMQDADELIRRCDAEKTRLFVVKQNRYNPPVVALKQAVDQGRFGRLLIGTIRVRWMRDQSYYSQDAWRGTWAWDGGVLTNQASHHVDLLTWIFGPVESVFARTETFLADIEAEDTGVAVLKFKSGALGIVEATTCARPKDLEGSISVLGEKGTVEIAGFAVNEVRTWQFANPTEEDKKRLQLATNPPDVYGFGHVAFMRDVITCIRENRSSMIDGLEGRRSIELINAIYESAESKSEVTLGSIPKKSKLGRPGVTKVL